MGLISNKGFTPLEPMISYEKYRIVDFAGKEFRFFYARKAIDDIKKENIDLLYRCFDFQYNKVQNIDLNQINKYIHSIFENMTAGKPVFDFRQNPLSDQTKQAIEQAGKQESVEGFQAGFDEQIARFNKDKSEEKQALRNNEELKLSNDRIFALLAGAIGFASFASSYIASLKLFRQSMTKSLTSGFGSLVLMSPIIFYLYKNKQILFNTVLSDKEVNRKKFLIKNYEEQIRKIKEYKNNITLKFKSFLIYNKFYILYSE